VLELLPLHEFVAFFMWERLSSRDRNVLLEGPE
jgi:hypothetical protein